MSEITNQVLDSADELTIHQPATRETPLSRMLATSADTGDYAGMLQVCELVAKSSICPKEFVGKAGDVLIAIDLGAAVGLPPLFSLQSIAVINGRPTIWGDGMLAIIKHNGGRLVETELLGKDFAFLGYECTAIRAGHPDVTRRFTMAEAKTAGLANKQGPWTQYPNRMCQMRARGFACRDQFADWLNGMISREEAADVLVVDNETGEVTGGPVSKVVESRSDSTLSKLQDKDQATDGAVLNSEHTDPEAPGPSALANRFGLASTIPEIESVEKLVVQFSEMYTADETDYLRGVSNDARKRVKAIK